AVALAAPVPALGAGYGLVGARWVKIAPQALPLARLPRTFDGLTLAFLADIHHGPFTWLEYGAAVVPTTLALPRDLIVLGGDYSLKDTKYIRPCLEVLSGLKAPLGVFGVLGNHDYWHGVYDTKEAMAAAGVTELTNTGVWVTRGSS